MCSDELACDSFSKGTSPLPEQEYAVYTSSRSGDRFSLRTGKIRQLADQALDKDADVRHVEVKFAVNKSEVFQTILGIGGAFTGLHKYVFNFIYLGNYI